MNNNKKSLMMILILALQTKAFAFDPSTSTVQVHSGLCDGDQDHYRGSGLLFSDSKNIYVLTSEHVVLHGTKNSEAILCTNIWNDKIGNHKAILVQADWGSGLALLKIVDTGGGWDVPDSSFFSGLDPVANTDAVTSGFPFQSQERFSGLDGVILNTSSDRALIPLQPRVVEIIHSHGEYGMSGGPVFTADGQSFVGVLSHQFMQYVPGGASTVGEYNEHYIAKADHVFAISKSSTNAWLRKILNPTTTDVPSFVRDWSLQLAATEEAVFSSGLKFTLVSDGDPAHTSEVGGSSGHGIGGSSGHGIGGSGSTTVGNAVEISIDLENHLAAWDFAGRSQWLQAIKAQLVRNHRVQIPFFVKKSTKTNGDTHIAEKITLDSLEQFVILLQRPDLNPVTMILDGKTQDEESRAVHETALKGSGTSLKGFVSDFRIIIRPNDIVARQYLTDLDTLASILVTGDWSLVEVSWVTSLAGNQNAFKALIDVNFDESVELIQTLKAVELHLKKLVIE